MKGRKMKQLVRITGRNGVIYEELMTQEQIRQFLRLTEANISLGVAFEEWEITIKETMEQTLDENEQTGISVYSPTSAVACPVCSSGR
jgi:hypothetical protein